MLEILQLYVSGFWVWLGITIGVGLIVQAISIFIYAVIGRKENPATCKPALQVATKG